jgi:hypothetical protein
MIGAAIFSDFDSLILDTETQGLQVTPRSLDWTIHDIASQE